MKVLNIKRLQNTLKKLNQFTDPGQGINRLAYTKTERNARRFLIDLFKEENMTVKLDAVGNIIARREGIDPNLPAVAFGSHIDSVYEAGRYDGTIGVLAALEVIRSLNEQSIMTEHPLEVISFACEESSRFGISTLGSKAMAGLLKKEELSILRDKDNLLLKDVFEENSLNLDKLKSAERKKENLKSFFELHIEQGPVLEKEKKQIGVVTGIASPSRFILQITGRASHSGTTPMSYRKDAFLGAAEIALALESAAISEASNETVATTGVCEVKPGGMNIVPGYVELQIDIRGTSTESKKKVINVLYKTIQKAENSRNLSVLATKITDEKPLKINEAIIADFKEICAANNYSYQLMHSGAGHDAMNMALLCPTGLIFIPSKNGLSHNPDEFSTYEQIAIGATLLEQQVLKSAKKTTKKEVKTYESI